MIRKSILEMARGAIMERVDNEVNNIINNILDVNTQATATRTITLKIAFKPDAMRQQIGIETSCKTALAPAASVSTSLFLGIDRRTGEIQCVENVPDLPGQLALDGSETNEPVELRLAEAN